MAPHPKSLLRNRIFQHTVFWIGIYFFDVFVFGFDSQRYGLFFKIVALEMPGQMLLAYVMMYWAIPEYFKKNYVTIALGLLSVFFFVSFVVHALFLAVNYYTEPVGLWDVSKLIIRGFYLFANAAIAVIIKLTKLWYENEKRVGEMLSTRLESELKMLKEQVNPHFMFNTLNNLYGLIERNPHHAQEMVLGLSRILHYMLHESNQATIELKKEIDCVRDYIALEKLRYSGQLSVSLNQQEHTGELSIVPLVLFPFVENSFKHGASETIESAWINIDISTYKDNFVFKIENSKHVGWRTTTNGHGGGIGLTNARRRLDLVYGTDHSLQIIDAIDSFLVVLKIRSSRMNAVVERNETKVSYR